ncbi:hypothetical protein GCM10011361_00660 [Muriicola marianensis]|uniref:Uncharacterized protein n=2 Tax=Muriicola marianensis TaxID=1324801 RepID=A0ABQ1QN39_9FLAO|nr:hypothetical protein GCM10011361_00660 [Muriicola marianensis]
MISEDFGMALGLALQTANHNIMKKALLIFSTVFLFLACGGVKKTQEAINTGNYQQAINSALRNLADNKDKRGNQPYVLMLEEAFAKNMERELQNIAFLEKDGNPANLEAIYKSYTQLRQIQERIRPLLPLYVRDENRNARFNFKNFDEDIIDSKDRLSDYLYDNALSLFESASSKLDYRRAYEDFRYLDEINPGYADTKEQMEVAYQRGLDYVKVKMVNDTQVVIPERLEEELLNFNTYGLDDLWTQYHNNPLENIRYDYEMQVAFREINISPEQVNEKQFVKEKQVKDGYRYLEDENGNLVKDSLGNEIKVDNFKTVTCNYYQFTQQKMAQVTGLVSFVDLNTKQQLNTYPLSSEFLFQHVYANYSGDRRALDNDLIALLNLGAVPFPSNEQMVYDAGEDLKAKLKQIIVRHRFN